ncbi:bifunctional glmU domain protein [Mycobacterium kansasii 824]|nr:bifunctional glmU domain protein [Mycobacterium kansasii 824]
MAGVNNRVQLAQLGAELNRRIVAAHQMAGVTVIDPTTTWIDVDVAIGRDTVIHPAPSCWAEPRSAATAS